MNTLLRLATSLFLTAAPVVHGEPTPYERYNRFAIENFGVEQEPLTATFAGETPVFVEGGDWVHPSRHSAAVGFETNLPTRTWVEFGPTEDCARRTAAQERMFYVHLHRLTDLPAESTCHYRLVAVDGRGRTIRTPIREFVTPAMPDAIEIPGQLGKGPYHLDQDGATYLLTQDLRFDTQGFVITGKRITLDLGGRTVTYNQQRMDPVEGDFWTWIKEGGIGARIWKTPGGRLLNGIIRQGAGGNPGEGNGLGYNPIYLTSSPDWEIAGLTLDYHSPQNTGLFCHWGGSGLDLHHNIFLDRGSELLNRHGAGSRAFNLFDPAATGVRTHHNLVKRTRQGGLGGNMVHHNEIHMDSWATNAFGIKLAKGGTARGNRILGGGYHVCAFGWGTQHTAHHNFVHLKAEAFPELRFEEFGRYASLNALRLTQYRGSTKPYEDNLYHHNVFALHNSGGRQVRGVQVFSDPHVRNYLFRDNVVKVVADDARSGNGACVVTQGLPERTSEMLPVHYRDTTFLSNTCHVKFGDDYGVGSNHRFERCRFVKLGGHAAYHTFRFNRPSTSRNHVLLDCSFEGGAAPTDVVWGHPEADHGFHLAWTLRIDAPPGAIVAITDRNGDSAFTGHVPASGSLEVPLTGSRHRPGGIEHLSPHQVTITHGGQTQRQSALMDRSRKVRFAR